jgi:hypothetical protein
MDASNSIPPTIDDSPQGLRVTWQGKQDTFNAIRSSLIVLIYIAFATWVGHLLRDMRLQGRELSLGSWIVLGITVAYLVPCVIWRVFHVIESLMNREIVTINEQSISFMRKGPGRLKQQASIPASQVKYINQAMAGFYRTLYLELTFSGNLLNRLRPIAIPVFCRGIDEANAFVLLRKIHERFPQYQDIRA